VSGGGPAAREKPFEAREEAWLESRAAVFTPDEKKLTPILNDDLKTEPNLPEDNPSGGYPAGPAPVLRPGPGGRPGRARRRVCPDLPGQPNFPNVC